VKVVTCQRAAAADDEEAAFSVVCTGLSGEPLLVHSCHSEKQSAGELRGFLASALGLPACRLRLVTPDGRQLENEDKLSTSL